jgi:hypothetical protein
MPVRTSQEQGRKNQTNGQSLVEFALVLPVLLLLVLGAMDVGRLFYTKIVLTNAAREGVNFLSRDPDDKFNCNVDGDCYLDTWGAIHGEGTSSGLSLIYTDVDWVNTNCCTPGSPVEITITKSVDLIFDNFLQWVGLLGGPIQLTSTVTMVVQ